MARHSETEEWLVVYQALYGERGFWLRPLSLWLQPVNGDATTRDSSHIERFTLLETNQRNPGAGMEPG